MAIDAVTNPSLQQDEQKIETSLRPSRLDDFIGQQLLKDNITILTQAAKQRGEAVEHVLLHGSPGLGKTTLAHIIAEEMGAHMHMTSGPAIDRAADLAAILTNVQEGDVLFIDEIHRLHKVIEELLYPAMEDYALDIITGKGPAARTLRIDLPRFTVIGATTRLSLMASPLRDRFGAVYKMEFYTEEEMQSILQRSAKILNVELDEDSAKEIAHRCRRTPRIANRLLKRVRDYAQVKNNGIITQEVCSQALDLLDIDPLGLNTIDRKILATIIEQFDGGPVGLSTIAAATAEEVSTVESIYEPFLMQIGMLQRTTRGRTATKNAYNHLKIAYPE